MATNKRPVLDLDAEAQAALDEARAMPQGPERTAALKKAGILRKAADSHNHLCEAGETQENLGALVDNNVPRRHSAVGTANDYRTPRATLAPNRV